MAICTGADRRSGNGRWRRSLATALVATGTLAGGVLAGAAGPAQAGPGRLIVFKTDPRGDVTVLPPTGPGKVARASIDLRSVTLVEQLGGVQMTIGLQRILTKSKYDQVVEVQMKPADQAETWFLDASMSGRQPTSATASYSADVSDGELQTCQPLQASVDPEAATLSLTVPDQCLPTSAAKIRVFSSLVTVKHPAGSAGFALDKLPIRGSYLMHDE